MKKCILIFDDDHQILVVCRIVLEQLNFRVETRTICDNVIEDVIQVKPDMILMDLWIPEIGGEQAIGLMKNNKSTQHIPIIVFSVNDNIEKISERVNASGFLKKPFKIESLKRILDQHIHQGAT